MITVFRLDNTDDILPSDSVIKYLTHGQSPDFSSDLDSTRSRILFAGFHCIITRTLRHGDLQQSAFVSSLKEFNFPDQVIIKKFVKLCYC